MMKTPIMMIAIAVILPGAVLAETPQAPPKSVSCISLRDIDSTEVKSSSLIIFKMRGRKYYKNELAYSCPSLNFEKAFSMHTSSSQLCSLDIIRVLHTAGGHVEEGAGCGLGKFVEYTPPPKTEKPKS
jgi:hypothetical protein